MSDKPDHLIERAAALLRSASAVSPSDAAEPPTRPAPPPARVNGGSVSAGAIPPLYTPPRAAGAAAGPLPVPGQGFRRAAPVPAITSVADLPPSGNPPVSIDALERAGLMIARHKRTRISEEFRIVIGRVLRALHEELPQGERYAEEACKNLIMVTSARPGEGKSFTALNLAGSIAQNAEEPVLLVDMDAKVRPISYQLGLGDSLGFMDLIGNDELSPDQLVLRTDLPHLHFMPLGSHVLRRGTSDTEEDDTGMRPITPALHRIAQRYPKTVIVLDVPPCLSTSDPHTLSPHVNEVVLVVEAERTQRSEVEAALDLIRVCPNITMLLNKVRLSTGTTFGAYDYFGTYT